MLITFTLLAVSKNARQGTLTEGEAQNTVDLQVLTTLDQLLLIMQEIFKPLQNKLLYLYEEVNRT